MGHTLDAKVPSGNLEELWTQYRGTMNLVAPNNKRRIEIIVVGTGLAGASAAATLGEPSHRIARSARPLSREGPR